MLHRNRLRSRSHNPILWSRSLPVVLLERRDFDERILLFTLKGFEELLYEFLIFGREPGKRNYRSSCICTPYGHDGVVRHINETTATSKIPFQCMPYSFPLPPLHLFQNLNSNLHLIAFRTKIVP